ncbi:OLC1v1030012C1 [Oldenlandia corymbosa var. corymbosa]|uniref:protein-serine/threonine phosphatase n=1 Tax=Oldenlandia corymbosa var. corymbosa TaxID=529605 RepID=A0AAV1CFU3_OLDCO|nr:OLC1v1030012C1 [Oldenlandia corymbosa var. corymbosa]
MKLHSSMHIKRRGGGKRNARQKKPGGEDGTLDCKEILVPEEGPADFRPEKRLKAGDFNAGCGSSSSLEVSEKSRELPREVEKGEGDTIREEKDSGAGGSRQVTRLCFGSISVMGRSRVMEDALTASPGILAGRYEFFAVYDGHGGAMVAHSCRDRLHHLLEEELMEAEEPTTSTSADAAAGIPSGSGETESKMNRIQYWTSIMEATFSKMDEEVQVQANEVGKVGEREVGSTAVVAVVGTEELVVANCGDSRAVLSRGGVALPLSNDHKPDRPDEKDRVEAAGGKIIDWDGCRVQGVLATSRSIGDHYLKPYVISKPEVTVNKRTEVDEFLIVATDGLWDVLSNDTACEVVRRCFNGQKYRNFIRESDIPAEAAAVILAELAMAKGSRDNISVIVVDLKEAGSKISGC